YFRELPAGSDWVFYRKRGRKYLPLGDFRKSWRRACEKAGVHDLRFHDLRRCAYTELVTAGNHPYYVMQVSGHARDMSRVYFGRDEMVAAQSIRWTKPDTSTGHVGVAER
ncbi:unnamed protein product, partial [marine sediment metagenome]